ncbi:replication restart helicase PriA [Sinanaerobacter chloroacetimidivorans]|uniref:Replication restart protein PriA n=1 Tax=Sinanaerobacter chloroacetimidivorans TaxID=2818044 RepID=A0A8J7W6U8_9FIRM|nr:primosomal protein N' [Sinanaerobacter chloroacetimidivorans]MBR0600225.1 primosomal protein N' [Sinanaerobacter chloroacetimidivorans]
MKYVNVVIDNNNDNTDNLYTYRCEDDTVQVGTKVLVPFAKGNRIKDAYVFQILDRIDEGLKGIKTIVGIDPEISLSEEAVAACVWMKNRYLCRYIDAVNCFTPSGTSSKRGKIRTPYKDFTGEPNDRKPLTEEQKNVMEAIIPSLEQNEHKVFLIHGVTSSGKTEIYMRAIEECIKKDKTAVMLVPEISLTTQTIERLMGRFGHGEIAVLHSKLSLGERYDEWMRIKRGEVKIVIGARSGVFAPLTNIGVIILDEEHETTYKSDMTPKYDTIEVAVKRAELNQSVVLLGSATPSLTSSYRADRGVYQRLYLRERYNKAPLPAVEIVDMREELKRGNKTMFSVALYQEMKQCLEKRRQIILFLNRRGYSTFVSCRSCGYVMNCKECGISLTFHKSLGEAVCHFCGYHEKIPSLCPECHGKYIKHFGTGTEKVEEAAKELFPDAVVDRLDLDTTTKKGSIDKILNNFKKGKTNILVGTQLVAKGLDFANVSLVGVVSADISLNVPDFRSPERTFQLITQAAGRAGRGENPGKVIIQSYTPEHYSIAAAAKHDYQAFYQRETLIREQIGYPPFSDLIQIILSSETEEEAQKGSEKTALEFIAKAGQEEEKYLLGPNPAPMNKVKGLYRYQLLIKCMPEKREFYFQILNEIKLGISTNKNVKYLISIDINPYSFL